MADFAKVSLSTVERVERAEQVGPESLDRIARALGYEPGAFTDVRIPRSREESVAELVEAVGNLEMVAVREFQTHRQVRTVAATQAYLLHRPELGSDYDEQIDELTEWLDLASMVMSSEIIGGDPVRRRTFCDQVLAAASEFRCRGVTVLVGVMEAPLPGLPDWTVAIISLTPKQSDPAASKRRTIMVDRRLLQPGRGFPRVLTSARPHG